AMVGPTLRGWDFAHRFSSPLSRALDTANNAGVIGKLSIDDDLLEWDYGVYEGRTNNEIQLAEPGWSKWVGALDGGESAVDVGARADRAIERLQTAAADGPVVVFAHGHLLAILIARWIGLDAGEGKRFVLDTATASVLSTKRDDRVLRVLNQRCGGHHIEP
ncbi:MAG: broad specificity phosphatase PhoE, partial [Verrucomicrobiales bacterium]